MAGRLLNTLKGAFPKFFRVVFALRDWVKMLPVRFRISMLQKNNGGLSVAYLAPHFPEKPARRNEFAHGGAVKLTYLAENFPHQFPFANLLYAVSSVAHPLQLEILETAKKKGLKIVVNQNGVAFPAWDGKNYERTNHSLKKLISFADFILYQSQFCKDSAERYISPPDVPNEIIYNPVDTRLFSPDACPAKPETLTLLLGGNQYEKYRLELALQTLKALHRDVPTAKLIVTGNLWLPRGEAEAWTKQTLRDMNLTEHVTFTGTYAQTDAPDLYSQAHLLLHTKYADPSPGLVLEALALGMPVVHLSNGGVPELVGNAGIGVHVEHDWDKINLPNPQAMADAVMQVFDRREEFSQKARQRAVDLFSLEKFTARHKDIFEKVLGDSHL
ncbi:MAG: glycosyltransferase family 4 protein [Anaerolineales bacterium]|nr:glycosyltransferase family 4 protein [Anaerolineales bacterium]